MKIKKNIGIIGNHYGVVSDHCTSEVGPAWLDYLSQEHKVINLCEPNASFTFCYKLFLHVHNHYDQIIFLIPSPGGVTVDIPSLTKRNSSFKHFMSFNDAIDRKKIVQDSIFSFNNNDISDSYKLTAVENYFLYIRNKEVDDYYQYLCVDNIKKIKDNTIVIPCYKDSIRDYSGTVLSEIDFTEVKYFFRQNHVKICHEKIQELRLRDYRKCHMTKENNFLFFKKILEWLDGDPVKIILKDFSIQPSEFELYWRKK